jgi:hypothetical protein
MPTEELSGELYETLRKDVEIFFDDLHKAEKAHEECLLSHREMTKRQESSCKTLKHLKYCHDQLGRDIRKLKSRKDNVPEINAKIFEMGMKLEESAIKLAEMERDLPASSNGLYLSIILGSNLSVSLLNPDDRYKYKEEYEWFKRTVTFVILVVTFLTYMLETPSMDALCNFLLVWYYCTLTIRESILRVNGSRIKGWWVLHHYISCILCGIILTWRDGVCYRQFRPFFIVLIVYVGSVQLLQTKYQTGCLRRLRALGQRHSMDITVEGFTSWMFKGLTFLLPFLIGGYMLQGYCSYRLFRMYLQHSECSNDWQVCVLAILFAFVALGNITTTLLVVFRKFAEKHKDTFLVVDKYRQTKID